MKHLRTVPEIESLLAHVEWVHALARQLVGDAHRAEDVAQDALLAAIRRPPQRASFPGACRAWLARVLANRARETHRADERRRDREAAVAQPVASSLESDVVERAETMRAVVEAVLALPEPSRSTVLMRFVDGLDYMSIAARTGTSSAAVRKRLSRGLALLRERFDDRGAGRDARAWVGLIALAESAGSAPATPLLFGAGVIMSTKILAGAAGIALAIVAYLYWSGSGAIEETRPDERTDRESSERELPVLLSDGTSSQPHSVDREHRAVGEEAVESSGADAPIPPVRAGDASAPVQIAVRGRCIAAEDGSALAGCTALVRANRPGSGNAPASELTIAEQRTEEDGEFELRFAVREGLVGYGMRVSAPGRCLRGMQLDPTREPAQRFDLGPIDLARAWRVYGRIFDETGRLREGIGLVVNDLPYRIGPESAYTRTTSLGATSDAEGRFAFEREIPAGAFRLEVQQPKHAVLREPAILEVRDGEAGLERKIVVGFRPFVSGTVSCSDGGTLPHGTLFARSPQAEYATRIGVRSGTFVFVGVEGDPGPLEIRAAPGGIEAYVHVRPVPWGTEDLHLELKRAGEVALKVVTAGSGAPVERFSVTCHAAEQARAPWIEQRLEGLHAGGELVVDGVPEGECVVRVHPEEARYLAPAELRFSKAAGVTPKLRVEVERAATLVVEVMDPDGAPIGASDGIMLIRPDGIEPIGVETRLVHLKDLERGKSGPVLLQQFVCDEKGRATLRWPKEERGCVLLIRGQRHPPLVVPNVDLLFDAPLLRVTAPRGGAIEGLVVPEDMRRFGLTAWAGAADRIALDPSTPVRHPHATVGADGRFLLDGMEPGLWNLYLSWEGIGLERPVTTIEMRGDERHVVELSAVHLLPANLEGTLVPQEGSALGFRIRAYAMSDGGRRLVSEAVVESDGRFRIADLPPGRVQLFAVAPPGRVAFSLWSEPIELHAGGRIAHEWKLVWRTLRFRAVREANSQPLARTKLGLYARLGDFAELETDAEGRVVIDMATLGPVSVQPRDDFEHSARIPEGVRGDIGDLVIQRRR